jgi:hypothetical protein
LKGRKVDEERETEHKGKDQEDDDESLVSLWVHCYSNTTLSAKIQLFWGMPDFSPKIYFPQRCPIKEDMALGGVSSRRFFFKSKKED